MGMDLAPASGYVLEVTSRNLSKLRLDLGEYDSLLGEFRVKGETRFQAISRLFNTYPAIEVAVTLGDHTSNPIMMFYTSDDGGSYDDLSDGLYLVFDEEDIFIKELTCIGSLLKENGVFPEYRRWTIYG